MADTDHYKMVKHQPFQMRAAFGCNQPKHADERNILKLQFGYTVYDLKIATASTTAVLAATTASSSASTTVTTGITNPDVPRALTMTVGGTSANIAQNTAIVVTGTNIEGRTITESFVTSAATAETQTGNKAFRTVSQVVVPQQAGSGVTVAIGTSSKLGTDHRLYPRRTTAVVVYDTGSTGTIDTAPTIAANEVLVENNTILPATVPNASRRYRLYYYTHNVSIGDINDAPLWSTSTSTSTSSTSTSTSSTSSSTSSTSSSTSSTSSSTSSTSTSSTSTSTTTVP